MEILTLNILPNGFTITNQDNKEVYSQYSSYNGLTWNEENIKSAANETYNTLGSYIFLVERHLLSFHMLIMVEPLDVQ